MHHFLHFCYYGFVVATTSVNFCYHPLFDFAGTKAQFCIFPTTCVFICWNNTQFLLPPFLGLLERPNFPILLPTFFYFCWNHHAVLLRQAAIFAASNKSRARYNTSSTTGVAAPVATGAAVISTGVATAGCTVHSVACVPTRNACGDQRGGRRPTARAVTSSEGGDRQ